jgi:uncharacterized protein
LILIFPKFLLGQPLEKMDGFIMFPIMILGPAIAGIVLTSVTSGRAGLRDFRSRLMKWRLDKRWYIAAVLIPPLGILFTLFTLITFKSDDFTPGFFLTGFLFGIPAGILEEIGWMGFAFPKMQLQFGSFKAAVLLGIIWGFWHFPVIDFLGTATPHGNYFWQFFGAFIAVLAAIRVIIVWIYSHTGSILLCQFMHIISTGSLVVFSPSPLFPSQEALWYAVYAGLLWIFVRIIRYNIRN